MTSTGPANSTGYLANSHALSQKLTINPKPEPFLFTLCFMRPLVGTARKRGDKKSFSNSATDERSGKLTEYRIPRT